MLKINLNQALVILGYTRRARFILGVILPVRSEISLLKSRKNMGTTGNASAPFFKHVTPDHRVTTWKMPFEKIELLIAVVWGKRAYEDVTAKVFCALRGSMQPSKRDKYSYAVKTNYAFSYKPTRQFRNRD